MLNDYKVPQDRKRIFFIGFRNDLNITFKFPKEFEKKQFFKDGIFDLKNNVLPAKEKNYTNGDKCKIDNYEFMTGGFSSIYMSQNRVRSWEEPFFTHSSRWKKCYYFIHNPKKYNLWKKDKILENVAASNHLNKTKNKS